MDLKVIFQLGALIPGPLQSVGTSHLAIEYLETALSEMSLKLEGGKVGEREDQAEGAGCTPVHTQPKPVPEAAGGRSWVRVVREGEEEDMAELPTNSQGLLPQVILFSDWSLLLILASDWSTVSVPHQQISIVYIPI